MSLRESAGRTESPQSVLFTYPISWDKMIVQFTFRRFFSMATKRVLAIHDMCSFGRCSLTAAIPVISAMGFQVCPFPTAIFSNNLTYGDYTFSDFTPHMTEFMDKVAPFTGAWIEIRGSAPDPTTAARSHPSRVRGLKFW